MTRRKLPRFYANWEADGGWCVELRHLYDPQRYDTQFDATARRNDD